MKKVLITGCAGYIGQHLAKLLNGKYDVYGTDIVTPSDVSNLKEFIGHDIRNPIDDFVFDLDNIPLEYDAIVHLAAMVRVGESVKEPRIYYDTNINGTINVLTGFNYHNFIYASTGAAENPTSPYGISKLAGEHIIQEHLDVRHSYAVPYTIFRFYNVIGTEGYPPTNPEGLMLNLMKIKETGKFAIFGNDYHTEDGTCVREYVHVMDICRAIETAIEKPSNNIENLAYGDPRTTKDIVHTFCDVNQLDCQINYGPRRAGDLEACYLKNPSPYMQRNYTYEEMLKI